MLAEDIAKLMAMIPLDEEVRRQNDADKIKVGLCNVITLQATHNCRAVPLIR